MKQLKKIITLFFPAILSSFLVIHLFAFLPGPQKTQMPAPVLPSPVKQIPVAKPIPAAEPVTKAPIEKPVPVVPQVPTQKPAPIAKGVLPDAMPTPTNIVKFQEYSIHPVWYSTNAGQALGRQQKVDKFRTICNQLGATENPKIPAKTADICRVATYNVHFWRNPYVKWGKKDKYDFDEIIKVIAKVNPDILILQEVAGGIMSWKDEFYKIFKGMGYGYIACCSTSEKGVDADGNLYNCILSKYPFAKPAIKKQFTINPDITSKDQNPEQRCFVGAEIQLPNNKHVSVYGTHLEVRPIIMRTAQGEKRELTPENARKAQLEELVEYINANDKNNNIIIGADFNGFRKQDLQYTIGNKTLWTILQESWSDILKVSDIPRNVSSLADLQPSSLALDYLAGQGYRDSFAVSGFQPPQFTTWTGTRIDFLFLNSAWNLPLKGSYVFYNWSSDHIPVFMDIRIG